MKSTPRKFDWRGLALALATTAAATLIGWLLYHGLHWPSETRQHRLSDTNVLMLYLLGVLWVAMRASRSAAILASDPWLKSSSRWSCSTQYRRSPSSARLPPCRGTR